MTAFTSQRTTGWSTFLLLSVLLGQMFVIKTGYADTPPPNITVSIPSVDARTGETFEVEVYSSDLTGAEVSAFSFTLLYDASLVQVVSATVEGTRSQADGADISLIYNATIPGSLIVAGAGITPLSGEGALVKIEFESLDVAGSGVLDLSDFLFNEGDPSATVVDGAFSINGYLLGDASLNGEVSAFDASEILQYVASYQSLSEEALLSADVSGNAEASAYDASLILQYVSEIRSCFPAEADCSASKQGDLAASAHVSYGSSEVAGDTQITLDVTGIEGAIYSLEYELESEALHLQEVTSLAPRDWTFAFEQTQEGSWRVVFAGVTPLPEGPVFSMSTGSMPAQPAEARYRFNEDTPQWMDERLFDEQPVAFTLDQNYPNPFNPTTTIGYALPEQSDVQLLVYDALGRQVALLVDATQEAGQHEVRFDARTLPSGTYYYRLQAGAFLKTQRMTLVK